MSPLRYIYMGLQVGLTERQAWMTNPGRIVDMFLWKRDYDMAMHGKRLKDPEEDDDL
jgi:hypothetical protein